MKTRTSKWLNICIDLLIILWGYASLAKLSEFDKFRHELFNQFLNKGFSDIFVYLIPATELLLVAFLITKDIQKAGLVLSAILLGIFTIYIGLILFHVFPRTPCSCGGVIELLGWKSHFFFNLCFLSLNMYAIHLLNKKRKEETEL